MNTIVKKHTTMLAFLFLIGTLMFATYLSVQRDVTDKELFTTSFLVLVSAILVVFALKRQKQLDMAAYDPTVPKRITSSEIEPGKLVYAGKEHDFLAVGKAPDTETVSLAAMRARTGIIYAVQVPLDHAALRRWYNKTHNLPIESYGWITNNGRYVSEEEAFDIASAAKQLYPNGKTNGFLTADELWPHIYEDQAA
jgi:hypothetical protein